MIRFFNCFNNLTPAMPWFDKPWIFWSQSAFTFVSGVMQNVAGGLMDAWWKRRTPNE